MTQRIPITDAVLLARTRNGDMSAYDELYRRHVDDAGKVARIVTSNNDEAQDVVAEAFVRVLHRLQHGGGPEGDLAPYLHTVVRRLAIDRYRSDQRSGPADPAMFDIMPSADDPMARATDRQLVRRAFEALPARWQEVLWHTEVEGRSPAWLASRLEMTPNAVAALAYRAREGLRQTYLSINLSSEVAHGCRPFVRKIPALIRGTLPARETGPLLDHLGVCADCRERRDELLVLVTDLPATLWPALLLPLGGSSIAAGAGAAAGGGLLAWLSPTRWGPKAGRAIISSTAGVAVAAIAVAATMSLLNDSDDAPVSAPSTGPDDVVEQEPPEPVAATQTPAETPEAEPSPRDTPKASPDDEPDEPSTQPEPSPPPETDQAPEFSAQPHDVTVRAGEPVVLSTEVTGSPTPHLQWQVRHTGSGGGPAPAAAAPSSWVDIPHETGHDLELAKPTPAFNGREYRVVATNDNGSVTSEPAVVTVRYPPEIVTQPKDYEADLGGELVLRASADANPEIDSVHWQVRDDGEWLDLPDQGGEGSTTTLTIDDVDFSDQASYRAVFVNDVGTTSTSAANVSVSATGSLQTAFGPHWSSHRWFTRCVRPADDEVRLSDCDGAIWRLTKAGELRWTDGRCLDVRADGDHKGLATTAPCTGEPSQQWTIDPDGSSQHLTNREGVCLTTRGWRHLDGVLAAHHCRGWWNQRFEFVQDAT